MTEKHHSPLHHRIMIGMIVGILAGLIARYFATTPEAMDRLTFVAERIAMPFGKLFIRLVIMVVLPLVMSALVLGVVEIGDPRKLGRIGLKTLGITALFSISAVIIGVTLANIIKPGVGLDPERQAKLTARFEKNATAAVLNAETAAEKSVETRLLDMIPDNLLREMVGAADGSSPGNGMLAVMIFALIFGVAVAGAGEKAETLVRVLEGIFAATMNIIGYAMAIAPYAVACLMFAVTATLGVEFLQMLAKFVITVLLGLLIHAVVVYSLALWVFARRSPLQFLVDAQEAVLTAFATSSSNATLPVSLRVAREELGIPPKISRFVLTVGATGNQNGTALFEGVVVLFLAQVFGVNLSLSQQFVVVLMAVMAGIGTAGVPGGSMPLIVGILRSINIQGASIALVMGVDRILDMSRTVVNVLGDLVVAACVAGSEPAEEEPESIADTLSQPAEPQAAS